MSTGNKIYQGLNKVLVFIEKHWKLILGIIVLVALVLSIKKCKADRAMKSDWEKVQKFNDSAFTSEIKKWKDAYNVEHTRAEDLTVDKQAMQIVADSFANLLKIKPKQIEAISKTGSSIAVSVKPTVESVIIAVPCPEGDSIQVVKEQSIKWADEPWLRIKGTINEYGSDLTITGTDTLVRIDYWKRKHWYSKKSYYADFTNSNKYIHTDGYKGIELKESPKRFSFGIGIQYGYPLNNVNLSKPVVHVGIGLQYTLFRL